MTIQHSPDPAPTVVDHLPRVTFTGLSAESFAHPLDRQAIADSSRPDTCRT
jgi:hypothetical protein